MLAATTLVVADDSPPKKSGWNLEIVPKAFQKNPNLNITVLSEQTAAGRELPPVSVSEPVYYILESGGYVSRGEAIKQKPFPASEVERILQRSLATSGYKPATAEHAPTLLIVYMWGAHNVILPENALSADHVVRNILDRAALAGGDKFAAELSKAFKESSQIAEAMAQPLGTAKGVSDGGGGDLGAAASLNQIAGMSDPVKMFKERSARNDFLLSQATSNCYFVVASAFDYASLGRQRTMLWRTRMTVTADGISQNDAIPTLITIATPYFGTDMPESAILKKHAVPKGTVEVGAPTVIDVKPEKPADGK